MRRLEVWFLRLFRLPSEHAQSIQILNTCRALAEEGARVRLMVERNPAHPVSGVSEALAFYGLEPHRRLQIEWLPGTHKGINGLVARWRILRARDSAVFYARQFSLARSAARTNRTPVIIELHRMDEKAVLTAKRAHGVVTVTSTLAGELRSRCGPSTSIEVIRDGVDLSRFKPPAVEGQSRVVYTGQLSDRKGVDVLIRALARLPSVPALIIGGREGNLLWRKRLQDLARKEQVDDRIQWTGHVPQHEIRSLLRRGDIGVVPTRAFGGQDVAASPLKLFEYMACGLPVIATDLRSIREVVRPGENGLLFPDGDADALAEAIRRMISNPSESTALAGCGLREAQRYSWQNRARRILQFVASLGRQVCVRPVSWRP